MRAVMRYTVKDEEMQSHLDLLRDVYDDMADTRPSGITWTTYQVTGTRTFVEFVEGPDLPEPLPQLESFQRYRVGLDDRCDGDLEFLDLQQIGTFQASPQ